MQPRFLRLQSRSGLQDAVWWFQDCLQNARWKVPDGRQVNNKVHSQDLHYHCLIEIPSDTVDPLYVSNSLLILPLVVTQASQLDCRFLMWLREQVMWSIYRGNFRVCEVNWSSCVIQTCNNIFTLHIKFKNIPTSVWSQNGGTSITQ